MAQKALAVEEERDDLDDYIAEQTARNREFPRLIEEATQRQQLLRDLARARKDAGLSQTAVAAHMHTSASVVARLERGGPNTTLATVQRYAAAVGKRLDWRLAD
jgi:ribosome-binding protein aMBF1 (putative translation factor)